MWDLHQHTDSLGVVHGPQGIWDLSFLTRDGAHIPSIARLILIYWATREVPSLPIKDEGGGLRIAPAFQGC